MNEQTRVLQQLTEATLQNHAHLIKLNKERVLKAAQSLIEKIDVVHSDWMLAIGQEIQRAANELAKHESAMMAIENIAAQTEATETARTTAASIEILKPNSAIELLTNSDEETTFIPATIAEGKAMTKNLPPAEERIETTAVVKVMNTANTTNNAASTSTHVSLLDESDGKYW